MAEETSKIMTVKDAIGKFVHDGDHLVIGNYTIGTCMDMVFEIIRQGKKDFTLYSQSGILDVECLIAAGCVKRLVTTYCMRSGGKAGGSALERALNKETIQIEDYSNFQYNAMLLAGMHGFDFIQVLEGAIATDLFKKRSFMGENKYRVIKSPYTGKDILTVPGINPDVCIVHVQRADKFGNAQYWGALGSVAAAALASKKIILSCEEIVEHDVIQSSPHLTIIPAFRVDAVIEIPWNAHPTEVLGYYNQDSSMIAMFSVADTSEDGIKAWLDEWCFGCKDRAAYVEHYISRYGIKALNDLKAKPFYSAPANYGSAYTSPWDENNRHRILGLTLEEFEEALKAGGKLYE
jgi:glutaconate CoA-transferase subunit A